MPALAQAKPAKLVGVGPRAGWNKTFDALAVEFEADTGIKVEFEWLPQDAAATRIRTQAGSRDGGIDVAAISVSHVMPLSPVMADYDAMFAEYGVPDGYDMDDIFPVALSNFAVTGKRVAMPYRFTTLITHYRRDLLEEAGITKAPGTFEEYRAAGVAVTEKFGPSRYGIGMHARESNSLVSGWWPFLLSGGGNTYSRENWEVLINKPEAVAALQYYGDLMVKDKVVVPDALTWEWDGLISGAQADRYAMTVTVAPYGTAFNDPAVSQTAGKWGWAKFPGLSDPSQSRSTVGGWGLAIPDANPNKRWAYELVMRATSKMNLTRSIDDVNSPPRRSIHTDPAVVAKLGWTSAFADQVSEGGVALPEAEDPIFPSLEQQLRPYVSRVMLGQVSAQESLDAAAADWERTLSRAGLK
jgi:ABC-type glycerol-3-phosphate transport system substrate-binding protein